jgi:hypothetical protein
MRQKSAPTKEPAVIKGICRATRRHFSAEEGREIDKGNFSTILKIQKALEKAGVRFADDETGEIGVSLHVDKR